MFSPPNPMAPCRMHPLFCREAAGDSSTMGPVLDWEAPHVMVAGFGFET